MNRLESLVVLGLFMIAGVVVAFVTGSAGGVITNDSTYDGSYAVVVPGHPPDVAWFVLCVTASLAIAVLLLLTASRLSRKREGDGSYEVVTEITISNGTTMPLHLIMEPWAREQDVAEGGSTKVGLTGPNRADIEIQVTPAGMTLYGWTGSVLDDGINPPGPPVPPTP